MSPPDRTPPAPATDGATLIAVTGGLLAVVSACALVIAKLLDDVMGSDDTARADPTIVEWVMRHRSDGVTAAARVVTHLGDGWVVATVCAAGVAVLCLWGSPRLGMLVAMSTVGSALATGAAKFAVDRPRPPREWWLATASGPAFPSGHATQSVALYGALAVAGVVLASHPAVRVFIVVAAGTAAFAVGGSRVYLAVHWPSDVLCGWAVSTLWLSTLVLVGWARPRLSILWARQRGDDAPDLPETSSG